MSGGAVPIVNQSLCTPLFFRRCRLRALWCPLIIVGEGWCRADCRVMVCELVGLRGEVGEPGGEEGEQHRPTLSLCVGVCGS